MSDSSKQMNSRGELGKKSDLAFRTISEVSKDLKLPQHVLRFWESKFSQLKPMKRNGRRRFYRREDMELLARIKYLLYDQGYTIKGVQKLLKDGINDRKLEHVTLDTKNKARLESLLVELQKIKSALES